MNDKAVQIKSLSQQVRWQLSLLGLGLFLASLTSLVFFSLNAISTTTKTLTTLTAQSIVSKAMENPDAPLPVNETEGSYRRWTDIPESVRTLFSNDDKPLDARGNLLEAIQVTDNGETVYFYLHHHVDDAFGNLYLLSSHSGAEIDATRQRLFSATLIQSFWSTVIIFTLLFLLIRWLFRRTSEPLELLSHWASDLGKNPNLPLKTDFPIEELNQLASQLREGVDRIETYNRREQEFLRHTSHELRTPLGIIQASLDTLALQASDNEKPSLTRAQKASENVRQLSTALLWLARDSDRPIEKAMVNLKDLMSQAIEDHRYLLANKKLEIKTQCTTDSVLLEKELLSIVFTNLVRNAFQHSDSGEIIIAVSTDNMLIINNSLQTQCLDSDNLVAGFGIGLQLVQRICQKLSWRFEFNQEADQVNVCIRWTPTTP